MYSLQMPDLGKTLTPITLIFLLGILTGRYQTKTDRMFAAIALLIGTSQVSVF